MGYNPELERAGDSFKVERARKASDYLNRFFKGQESSNKFGHLSSQLDEIFVRESPNTHSESRDGQEQIKAEIEAVSNKENLSPQEQEIMQKLAEYFLGIAHRSKNIERLMTSVSFLEVIKSELAVDTLKHMAENPLVVTRPEEMSIRADTVAQSRFPEGLSVLAAIKKYSEEKVKPEALRALIKLKQRMEIPLEPREMQYLGENTEKF